MEEKYYQVYIGTNHPRYTVLYTGITNNVFNRDNQHKTKINKSSFAAKYNINRIVYYETFTDVHSAIDREKEIKGWTRAKKIKLIESINPEWNDLVEKSFN